MTACFESPNIIRMKRFITTAFSLFLASHCAFAQFTSGRLAVLRVGTGSAALTNSSTALFLDEYTFNGTAGYSLSLPTASSNAIAVSGTATSEGLISFATNGNSIIVSGYNIAPGTASVASSTSATVPRAVMTVDASGTATIVASTTTNFSANNIRGAASDGSNVWASGASTGIVTGNGTGTGLSTVVSNNITNTRGIGIYANQLFYSSGSGSARGIYRVGTGAPTVAATGSTLYIDVTSSGSPYAFAFNSDTSICYVADDRTIAAGGGIQKWTRTGSTWSLAYTLATGTSSTVGTRGLCIDWSGANPVAYATTAESSANRIISITDAGASSAATTLATAATNTIFRGISFTPGSNPLPVTYASFKATSQNNQILLQWLTASESNNHYFSVQRSADGKTFETIGTVKGAGFSSKTLSYSFTDNNVPQTQTVFYRLKQVDFDGKTVFSSILSVALTPTKTAIPTILPNPFQTDLTVTVETSMATPATLLLTDVTGNIHYSSTQQLEAGITNLTIRTSDLPNGIYILRLSYNGEAYTQKILKN